MKAIRARNLRSLKDTGFINIRPLTFLIGENSSGKSSFLRLLPLLKQSLEAKTRGPLLWYGRYVDFGSYNEALNNYTEGENISLGFIVPVLTDFRTFMGQSGNIRNRKMDVEIELNLSVSKDNSATYTKGCSLRFLGHEIAISFDESQKVTGYFVNGQDYSKSASKFVIGARSLTAGTNIIPVPLDISRGFNHRISRNELQQNPFLYQLINNLKQYTHHKVSIITIQKIINSIHMGNSQEILDSLKESNVSQKKWTERATGWTSHSPDYKAIESLYLAWITPQILYFIDGYLYSFITGIKYIAPLRASAERYYRFQDLDATEMDFQGRNLVLVLQNMTHNELTNFTDWTIENFGFSVEVTPSGGHSAVVIKQRGSNHSVSLADMGFGFSQMIPIITQLWLASMKRPFPFISLSGRRDNIMTFAIEQPELHLHPRMQARLADVLLRTIQLARANNIQLNLVVETHSDTIINRIGLRIASGDIEKEDVSIIIFDKPDPNEPTEIKTVQYSNDGLLYDWPVGFFDPEMI